MEKVTKQLINKLKLEKHPEGGFYRRTYQSVENCHPSDRNGESRPCATAIYYLLEKGNFSAWHRIKSDEMLHHYLGTTLTIHTINENGELNKLYLGNPMIDAKAQFQQVIIKNQWFSASLEGGESFALIGCTVSPGFDFKDFELACSKQLIALYPQHQELITRFSIN